MSELWQSHQWMSAAQFSRVGIQGQRRRDRLWDALGRKPETCACPFRPTASEMAATSMRTNRSSDRYLLLADRRLRGGRRRCVAFADAVCDLRR